MIDTGTSFFMCDECPACAGVDYRLQIAKEGGYDPQLEYCWCEKLQSKFLFSGYCEDAISQKPKAIKKGKRKTGTAYRREMKQKHGKDLTWIIHNCGYNPAVGYIDWDWVDGVWQPVGKYIKYPKNSNAQQYNVRTGKIVRKSVFGKTQAEVRDKLAKAIREYRGAPIDHTGNYTVEQWMRLWFETYSKPFIRPTTASSYENYIENHIIPGLGRLNIHRLTPIHVQRFYLEEKESGRVPRYNGMKDLSLSNRFMVSF